MQNWKIKWQGFKKCNDENNLLHMKLNHIREQNEFVNEVNKQVLRYTSNQ